jgi:TPR repeat protein
MYRLGLAYTNGYGVAKDDAEALKWYRKGAAAGSDAAKKSVERLGGMP